MTIPPVAKFLPLQGQIRPHYDARSSLFNTDGQGFSDIGVPVVLFMENYDIERVGYHDTHDNMTLINLDYGAALAAITIEAVARAAATKLPAGYFVANKGTPPDDGHFGGLHACVCATPSPRVNDRGPLLSVPARSPSGSAPDTTLAMRCSTGCR